MLEKLYDIKHIITHALKETEQLYDYYSYVKIVYSNIM